MDECERENDIFIPMCVKIIGMIYLLLKSQNMKLFIWTPHPQPIFVTSICLLMSIAFSIFGVLRGRWSNIQEAESQPWFLCRAWWTKILVIDGLEQDITKRTYQV